MVEALYFTHRETEAQNGEGFIEALEPASEGSGLEGGHARINV